VFFNSQDHPVGGLFIGLTCVYAAELVASFKPVRPGIGTRGERALGFFHILVGFYLIYLTFAVVLNTTLNYALPV
jgi:hypothetical protein